MVNPHPLDTIIPKSQILIVDDDPFMRRTMGSILKSANTSLSFASEVNEAQSLIEKNGIKNFNCIITDYHMPQKKGTELIFWAKEKDPSLSTIMLTSNQEHDVLKISLKSGLTDYLNKSATPKEIIQSVYTAINKTIKNRQLKIAESEIDKATLIHKKFKKSFSESIQHETAFQISSYLAPVQQVGGDFINFFKISEKKLLIIAGDISGHDMKSGFISAFFQGLVKGLLSHNASIEEIASTSNNFLFKEWNNLNSEDETITSIATCFLLMDLEANQLKVLTNGFPPLLIIDSEGQSIPIGEGSAPLGWFDTKSFVAQKHKLPESGSCHVWSDGLIDFSKTQKASKLSISNFLEDPNQTNTDKEAFISERTDDILTLRIEWNQEQQDFIPFISNKYYGNQYNKIDSFQESWKASIHLIFPNIDSFNMHDILLSTREMILNALIHGCHKLKENHTLLSMYYNKDKTKLKIVVKDDGTGYNASIIKKEIPDLNTELNDNRISLGSIIIHQLSNKFIKEKTDPLIHFILT